MLLAFIVIEKKETDENRFFDPCCDIADGSFLIL